MGKPNAAEVVWGSPILESRQVLCLKGEFFALREKDKRKAARLRIMFNEILYKMVADDSEQSKISRQADDYEQSEGEGFSMPLAIRDRDKKNPSKF